MSIRCLCGYVSSLLEGVLLSVLVGTCLPSQWNAYKLPLLAFLKRSLNLSLPLSLSLSLSLSPQHGSVGVLTETHDDEQFPDWLAVLSDRYCYTLQPSACERGPSVMSAFFPLPVIYAIVGREILKTFSCVDFSNNK